MLKLFSYVVRFDSGFAPNPFWDYCSLACCKPQIRKHANVNDWIVGTGAKTNDSNYKLVYAMQVTEKLSFDAYFEDTRFYTKRPSDGIVEKRGDNICYKEAFGKFDVLPFHHTRDNLRTDLSGEHA